MNLDRVTIVQFRSIEQADIQFTHSARGLVGVNEAGKSNLLRALSMLSSDVSPEMDDVREPSPWQDPVDKSYVAFAFTFTPDEADDVLTTNQGRILVDSLDTPLFRIGGKDVTPRTMLTDLETLYWVDILQRKKHATHWSLSKDALIAKGWKSPSANCPPDYTVKLASGVEYKLKSASLIYAPSFPTIPSTYLADAPVLDAWAVRGDLARKFLTANLPKCLYWSYDPKFLLPGRIHIEQFQGSPEACIPLKHMFALTGIKDIKQQIATARSRPNGLANLLRRVSERASKHISEVWHEHNDIRISLQPNGEYIDASIQDAHNQYDLARRSDGFKRFVTFLLMVSAQDRTDSLSGALLLLDDPDVGLHPSGSRYLLKELLRISENNKVVYASHSIFMIDTEVPERHLIVRKRKEVTSVSDVADSDILDEEVLYNALNFSAFEVLKAENILFEGWRDKKFFQRAMSAPKGLNPGVMKRLQSVGVCHCRGVNEISRLSSIVELANRKCVIVSDGDAAARQQQKNYNGDAPWVRYDEACELVPVTVEDFVKSSLFNKIVANWTSTLELPKNVAVPSDLDSVGRLGRLTAWLRASGLSSDEIKSAMEALKGVVLDAVTPDDIRSEYYDALAYIAAKFVATQAEVHVSPRKQRTKTR